MTIQFSSRVANLKSSFIRDILTASQQPDVISFAGGLPDPRLFPMSALHQASEKVFQTWGGCAFQYGATQGLEVLRAYIAENLIHDVALTTDQLMITTGSQQGLHIVAECLLNPGDGVIVEAPSYLGALQVFASTGASVHSLQSDAEGPLMSSLESLLKTRRIKLIYCLPNFQNPTGKTYSLSRRQELSALLKNYPEVILLEDDPYYSLSYTGPSLPSLFSLLPGQSVRLCSFSKSIAPSFRLGWLQASGHLLGRFLKYKQIADLHSSGFLQALLVEFLQMDTLDSHLRRLREVYANRLDLMTEVLTTRLGNQLVFAKPSGGMFLWCQLRNPALNSSLLFKQAMAQKVAFVPSQAFYATHPNYGALRLNFTHSDDSKIKEGIHRLAKLF